MKKIIRILFIIFISFSLVQISYFSPIDFVLSKSSLLYQNDEIDFDPLVDLKLTCLIKSVRCFEDKNSMMFVQLQINNQEVNSPIWNVMDYTKKVNWSFQQDIPDDKKIIDVYIRLFNSNTLCDLNKDPDKKQIHLLFNVETGRWTGDDFFGDESGYGRLNGCGCGIIDNAEKNGEIVFDLFLNDYDHDNIPYWTEINILGTDPTVDNSEDDPDEDGIPTFWEWKWGYDPCTWDDHENFDSDDDGIDNVEEYKTSQWGSDPFRKDIYLEIDQMKPGPNGEGSWVLTKNCKELLKHPYLQRDIVLHIDDGWMGHGEMIPFHQSINDFDLINLYNTFFLENNTNNWKRGVFRYGLIVFHHEKAAGKAFVGEGFPINSNIKGINSFQISKTAAEETFKIKPYSLDFIYATYIMHEMGHTMGLDIFNPPGCDNKNTVHPLFFGWWKYANYKSVMNYRYVHDILDYSDGSHGKNDYNDWSNLDFSWFEMPKENDLYFLIQNCYHRLIRLKD